MKEQIKIALWNKVKSTYPIGTSKHTNALLEEDFENFIDEVVKICTIIGSVTHCVCTPDETTGTTTVRCCNICGKPTESFWYGGKKLTLNGLRVKLHFAYTTLNSFLLPGFHFLPRKGDLIDLGSLIDEKNYSDEELDEIYSLSWSVLCVNWGKDKFGVFAEITCEGE